MRAVVQRVSTASVKVSDKIVGAISAGTMILLGVEAEDTREDAVWLVQKIANLRIFRDETGVMNRSLVEVNGEALVVSQFTLHASTKKGNRPSYIRAARPEEAKELYEYFISQMENALNKPVQTGEFGAMMEVELVNDGPVTIIIDTKNKE